MVARPITPEQLARHDSEQAHQKAVMCWAGLPEVREKYPELKWLFHIPNGGFRHKSEAATFRAMGVKPGVPDLCLPIRRFQFSGLWIEMKKPGVHNKGRTTDHQDEWLEHLKSQGYGGMICYGWIEARDVLIQYLEYEE